MNTSMKLTICAVLFLLVGVGLGHLMSGGDAASEPLEKKPMYWVAPMDANYRRDQPGKSPMGMDLIPVYENAPTEEHGPGVVRISPNVSNNLGVRVEAVRKDVLHTEIKTVGYIKYDEDQLKHIHPRVEGWIEKLYVKSAGDPVEKDQPLYDLYSPQLVNAQEEYLLALSRNNKSLIKAAESRLKSLQLTDEFIRSLKKSRTVNQTTTFNSPQSGVIDNLNIREGFYVRPGTTLMSIGKLDQVWIEAEVFERQASLVKADLPVTMRLDYLQGKVWTGKVDYVYPVLDPKTRTLRVRLRFDNTDKVLKPNMFAEVTINAESSKPQLLVPKSAVIRTGVKDVVVLALGDGQFKSVAVEIAGVDENFIAIKNGITIDDEVVVSAQFLIDSESSKSSDFKRMGSSESDIEPTVWVAATVYSIDKESRKAKIEHKEIPEWDWPVMTMIFRFDKSVDISGIAAGTKMHMELSKDKEGRAVITNVHIMETKEMPPGKPKTKEESGMPSDNQHQHH